ncbi:MAG: helix-turn-helix transcriptional regulator [Micrococcaceae bacterium]|nr:helix-turn-helix transcriptional regulator [Micrococcaceae bacterium]
MSIDKERLSANIRAELARNRLTQKDAAAVLHIKPVSLSSRLAGTTEFKFSELISLADLMEISLTELLEGVHEPVTANGPNGGAVAS